MAEAVEGGELPAGAPRYRSLFIVWAPRHRGTRSAWLAAALGIDPPRYIAPTEGRGLRGAPGKYPFQLVATIRLLLARRPRVVFVQSPPSFAAWVAALYGAATGAAVVIDAHSDAFERSIWTRPRWVTRVVARQAVATIVTNSHWAQTIEAWGGSAMVVPNIPTDFPAADPPPLAAGVNVAVVNTWAPDEPIAAVIDAAYELPEVTFHVTGTRDRVDSLMRPVPANVRFTGFLPEDAYHGLLRNADAVVCLTTRNHTMQNGACEALSHETPVITSDWPVLRGYFSSGAILVDNTAAGIANGVRAFLTDMDGYRTGIRSLKAQRRADWERARSQLIAMIDDALSRRS